MAILPVKLYPKRKIRGLTLIEVLIALAIISIALTAIIKATSQSIRATDHLQNKTIAMWIGERLLNEARMGLLVLPEDEDTARKSLFVLDKTWYWQGYQTATDNQHIKKIVVQVFARDTEEQTPLIQFESYVTHYE
ncbi:MAG TPA: type II secretion system minor pseudopilin GspI [Gammaproteobacteria bacterium]|jgi:general secretion pathway protein I|nr:type II secretion system minor pseudopilin GspI [Gammaproteobacteria bacterium]